MTALVSGYGRRQVAALTLLETSLGHKREDKRRTDLPRLYYTYNKAHPYLFCKLWRLLNQEGRTFYSPRNGTNFSQTCTSYCAKRHSYKEAFYVSFLSPQEEQMRHLLHC